jgi:iron complex transport system substrate-binding protein
LLSACGNSQSAGDQDQSNSKKENTRIYQSENGPVKVPKHPKRVVVLSSFAGNVISLGVNVVGVSKWAKSSPVLKDKVKDAEAVSDQNLEKIIELNPDLIIGLANTKNVDKLKQIAPTVTYTYGKLDYLEQHIAIGKLLNKEEQAKKWVADFKKRAGELGEQIKEKIGQDATVSVFEKFEKQFYVFGENWGRGTEILYQAMDLKMPKNLQKATKEKGYQLISAETLPKYSGDYIIFSQTPGTDNSFQNTETYKNIPAVKKGHVIKVNGSAFYFNDPISLDYELGVFKQAFLGGK